jgi:argininosuccinate synthase
MKLKYTLDTSLSALVLALFTISVVGQRGNVKILHTGKIYGLRHVRFDIWIFFLIRETKISLTLRERELFRQLGNYIKSLMKVKSDDL